MKKYQDKPTDAPFLRTPYNYDRDAASDFHGLKCEDKSLAREEFAEESNINYIAERYGLTGELPQVLQLPMYGDFTGIFDFQTAQNAVVQAKEQFMTLPAKLRARFDNSPQQLLEFLADPENRKEAEFLGLINPQQEKRDGQDLGGLPPRTAQERPRSGGTADDTQAGARAEGPGTEAGQSDRPGAAGKGGKPT